MINILVCGNKKVFDGALTQLISILNRTKEPINYYIFTADVTRLKPDYEPITKEQVEFLNEVIREKIAKKSQSQAILVDVTKEYDEEFKGSPNENAYCTPYTLLRLLADRIFNENEKRSPIDKIDKIGKIDNLDKLLYLDLDIMLNGDIKEIYNINIENYEYAAVKEKYGCWIIRPDYINAGMLLFNMNKIKETKLLEKAREKIRKRKWLFADQDALFWSTSKKLILPRKYNEQSKFNRKDTIICHFCKRLMFRPYPHTENFKQWNIEEVHKVLKCYTFDKDLEEYIKYKKMYDTQNNKKERK